MHSGLWSSTVILLSILGLSAGSTQALAQGHPSLADCITLPPPILATPLEKYMGRIECSFDPIIASTAIRKSSIPKMMEEGMTKAIPVINAGFKPKGLNSPAITLWMPKPDQLKFLMPLVREVAKNGNDILGVIDGLDNKDIDKICSQNSEESKACFANEEDKQVCYAIWALKGAKKVGTQTREAYDQTKQKLIEARKFCEDSTRKGPVPSDWLCRIIPDGSWLDDSEEAQPKKNQDLVNFLKRFLVPYQAQPKNTVLNRLKLGDVKIQADPSSPNTYMATVAIDDIGLNGGIDVATQDQPQRKIIQDSQWQLNLKPGKKIYVQVPVKSGADSDGSYRFSVIPGGTRLSLKTQDFDLSSQSDPKAKSEFSQKADQLVSILSQELGGMNSNLLSTQVARLVQEQVGTGINKLLHSKQENLMIRHPLMPASVQRAVFDSMLSREDKNLEHLAETAQDDKMVRDYAPRARSFLSNLNSLVKKTPGLTEDARDYLKAYREKLAKILVISSKSGGGALQMGRRIVRFAGIPMDYSRTPIELLKEVDEQADHLSTIWPSRADINPGAEVKAETELKFFEDPHHPNYLFAGVATCPEQGKSLIALDRSVQYINPKIDPRQPSDFSVAVSADSINSYLQQMFNFGLLDAAVTGNESIRSVKFKSAPKIEIGKDGQVRVVINAAFDKSGIPDVLTNNVQVKLDVQLGLSPDQNSLHVVPNAADIKLKVGNREIQNYIAEMILKVPTNMFLPLAQPSKREIGAQVNDRARIPSVITSRVKNLKLNTEQGAVFLRGDIR